MSIRFYNRGKYDDEIFLPTFCTLAVSKNIPVEIKIEVWGRVKRSVGKLRLTEQPQGKQLITGEYLQQ